RHPLTHHSFPTRRSSDLALSPLRLRQATVPALPAEEDRRAPHNCRRQIAPDADNPSHPTVVSPRFGFLLLSIRHPLPSPPRLRADRKSTRLNSSHVSISY